MLAGGSSPHLAFSLLTKDGGKWHWAAWSATLHRTARPRLCTQFPAYSQSGPLSSISLGKQHTDGSLGHRTAHTAQASTCPSRTLGGLLHFHTCGQTLGNSGLPAMCCERCPVCSFPPEQPWDSRAASGTESELTLALTKQAHRASGPHPSPQLLKHVSCRVFILQPYFQALLRSQSLYCCQSFLHPSWLCLGLGSLHVTSLALRPCPGCWLYQFSSCANIGMSLSYPTSPVSEVGPIHSRLEVRPS